MDRVFSIIFIILLFIPIIKINFNKVSKKENRTLAKLEKFSDFDNWINDRFYMRNNLIQLNHNFVYYTALRYPHINYRIIDKKTKELNRYAQSPVNKEKLVPEEYKQFVTEIQNGLIALNNFCNKYNIKLYVMILPEKESVHHPSIIVNNNDEKIEQFISEINENNNLKIIFPLKKLQESAKNEYMFFKTDHHLTNDGYFIAYQELMKEIKKDYLQFKVLQKNDFEVFYNNQVRSGITSIFNEGSLCNTLGLSKDICYELLDIEYKYYIHKNEKELNRTSLKTPYIRSMDFYYPSDNNLKLLTLGNSNVEGLSTFLSYSFTNTKKIRLNGPSGIPREEQYKILKYYEDEILEFKPDLMILCIGYDVIEYLSDIGKE